MKRNLISELQQRSRSTFLKYRAPCAAARSLAANGRSPPRGPPTAASPASWGAATPPSAPAWPTLLYPPPQHGIAQAKFLGHRSDRAATRCDQINRLPLVVVRKRTTLTSFHPTPPGSSSLLQVSISSEEVYSLDDRRGVTFKWKDYRIEGPERYGVMTLDTHEFIRRFLMHVLPSGFHRIRYYGLLASSARAKNIARIRKLLAVPLIPIEAIKAATTNPEEPKA